MQALKHCFNPKILIGLALVAIAVLIFNARLFMSVLPILLLAACPLSMFFMMKSMGGMHDKGSHANSMDILRQRLAKGDISEQDFDRMKEKLQAH